MKFKVPSYLALIFALALVAGFAALSLRTGPQAVSAESSGAEVSFTKWVIGEGPNMAGFVSGDAGAGAFTGEVITMDPTVAKDRITEIEALYHFKGTNHSFDAHIHARMYNRTGMAEVTGMVTDGWLAGTRIDGEFKTIKCDQGTCFEGVLRLLAGTAH